MRVNYGVQLAEVPGVPLNREQIVTKFTVTIRRGRAAVDGAWTLARSLVFVRQIIYVFTI